SSTMSYRIAIDRGGSCGTVLFINQILNSSLRCCWSLSGTFTDVFAVCPGNRIVTLKLLSSQPSQYSDAPFEAIRRILAADGNKDITQDFSDIGIYLLLLVTISLALMQPLFFRHY